jgi:hypothetical protein
MNDPVRGCDVYKNIGCTHVDGYLCDYPSCSILKDYRMNERIKELEKQATTVVEGWSDENGTTRYYEFDRKKFAELIILECMRMCKTAVGNADYNTGRLHCLNNIKEHFGVEE